MKKKSQPCVVKVVDINIRFDFVKLEQEFRDIKCRAQLLLGRTFKVKKKSTGLKFCKADVLQVLHIVIVVMLSP